MADLTIRPVTADDLPALRAHSPRPNVDLAAEHFALVGEQYLFVAAWLADEPQGWGVLDMRDDELTPELAHLWVFPQYRRTGVGKAITQHLEEEAEARDHEAVFLIVDPNNSAAIPMYLDLGYSPTGHHLMGTTYVGGEQTHQAIYRRSLSAPR